MSTREIIWYATTRGLALLGVTVSIFQAGYAAKLIKELAQLFM